MRVRINNRDALMDMLREDLYGKDLEIFANRVGVSKSTLYAIRSNRTKWPRHTTLLTLIHVLGYELWLEKTNSSSS